MKKLYSTPSFESVNFLDNVLTNSPTDFGDNLGNWTWGQTGGKTL